MVASNGQRLKEKSQKIPPKPSFLKVLPENIPQELKATPNWMCWSYELRQNGDGEWKWTKPPLQINSRYAKSDRPDTWTTFDRVIEHYISPFGTEPNGIGFRPTGDITGTDLDHCRDPVTGEIDEWAMAIIREIDSYTELSPSGTGIRIFCFGKLPPGRRKRGNVEMYDESSPKYLTITGHHLPGTPRTLQCRQSQIHGIHTEHLGGREPAKAEDQRKDVLLQDRSIGYPAPGDPTVKDIVDRAADAANGEKFMKLYHGDVEGAGYSSLSEAELAFVSMVAFWAGPNPELIDAVYRASGLRRDKWDSKRGERTYGELTIEKAMGHETYYNWGDGWSDDVHDYCKPFDPDVFDDCPDERPAFETDLVDPSPTIGERTISNNNQPKAKRRRGVTLEQVFDLPSPVWQIDQHFAVGAFVTLFGPSGVGKSFVALDHALCIATGTPYLGRYESIRGPVIYVAGEGVSGLRNRVKAWMAHHKIETPPSNFIFIPTTFNLLDEDESDELIQIARDDLGQNPSLIVIDTLARNFGCGNENATQDMNQFITNLDRLKAEFNCTVLVIHHTGKDATKKERGNTALRGASDTMILLDETDSSDGVAGGAAVFCVKQKDAPEFDRYVILKHKVELEDDQESIVFNPKDKTATEYQFLKPVLKDLLHTLHSKHGEQPFLFSQGCADAGLPKATFTDRLQTLVKRNLVTKTIDDQYRLTAEATRLLTIT
jgi:putative DNA primase/helicase